jgi:hypothetical protein
MCNWRGRSTAASVLLTRTFDRSDHGGIHHLSGDQIVRRHFSESQESVDELSLAAFAMARHPAHTRPLLARPREGEAIANSPPADGILRLGAAQKPEGRLVPSQGEPNWETPRRSRCVNLVGPARWRQPWDCVRLGPASLRRTRADTGERTLCASCVRRFSYLAFSAAPPVRRRRPRLKLSSPTRPAGPWRTSGPT